MRRPALAVFAVVLVVPLSALADAVPSPPESCPPGSYGETSHSGQWCQPSTCKTDEDCKSLDNHWARKKSGPHVCRMQPLCVLHTTVPPGGRSSFRNPTPIPREIAKSDCNKGCSGGAQCERVKRCVVTNAPATPTEEPPNDGKDASVVSIPTASPDAAPIDVKVVDPPPSSSSSSGTASPPSPTGARGCGCTVGQKDPTGMFGSLGVGVLAFVTLFRRSRRR